MKNNQKKKETKRTKISFEEMNNGKIIKTGKRSQLKAEIHINKICENKAPISDLVVGSKFKFLPHIEYMTYIAGEYLKQKINSSRIFTILNINKNNVKVKDSGEELIICTNNKKFKINSSPEIEFIDENSNIGNIINTQKSTLKQKSAFVFANFTDYEKQKQLALEVEAGKLKRFGYCDEKMIYKVI